MFKRLKVTVLEKLYFPQVQIFLALKKMSSPNQITSNSTPKFRNRTIDTYFNNDQQTRTTPNVRSSNESNSNNQANPNPGQKNYSRRTIDQYFHSDNRARPPPRSNRSSSNKSENYQSPLRSFRIQVIEETIRAVETGGYKLQDGRVVNLPPHSIQPRTFRDADTVSLPFVAQPSIVPPTIKIVRGDCLLEGLRLKNLGYNPIVLNMASFLRPGGGYLGGAGAQEENLFRRTNLFQFHDVEHIKSFYPIPHIGAIYCPNALVLRDSEDKDYRFLDNVETMSFVAVAAIKNPKLIDTPNGPKLNSRDTELTRRKIRAMLNVGLAMGHDAIVLSAFGCGAYGNPSPIVSQLFSEVITNEYFPSLDDNKKTVPLYKYISFAIIDDSNAAHANGREGNLAPFQRAFERFGGNSNEEDVVMLNT